MNNRIESRFFVSYFNHVKRMKGQGKFPIRAAEIKAARDREHMRRRTTGGRQPPAATAGNLSPRERQRTTGGGELPFNISTTTTTTMPLILFSPYVGSLVGGDKPPAATADQPPAATTTGNTISTSFLSPLEIRGNWMIRWEKKTPTRVTRARVKELNLSLSRKISEHGKPAQSKKM